MTQMCGDFCSTEFFSVRLFINFFIHLQKISAETAKPKSVKLASSRPSQKSILSGIVRKRKASGSCDEPNEQIKKLSTPANDSSEKKTEENGAVQIKDEAEAEPERNNPSTTSEAKAPIVVSNLSKYDEGALKCIGILPGIGEYRESSDSEKSTDTDEEYDFCDYDWMGRKMKRDGEDGECH